MVPRTSKSILKLMKNIHSYSYEKERGTLSWLAPLPSGAVAYIRVAPGIGHCVIQPPTSILGYHNLPHVCVSVPLRSDSKSAEAARQIWAALSPIADRLGSVIASQCRTGYSAALPFYHQSIIRALELAKDDALKSVWDGERSQLTEVRMQKLLTTQLKKVGRPRDVSHGVTLLVYLCWRHGIVLDSLLPRSPATIEPDRARALPRTTRCPDAEATILERGEDVDIIVLGEASLLDSVLRERAFLVEVPRLAKEPAAQQRQRASATCELICELELPTTILPEAELGLADAWRIVWDATEEGLNAEAGSLCLVPLPRPTGGYHWLGWDNDDDPTLLSFDENLHSTGVGPWSGRPLPDRGSGVDDDTRLDELMAVTEKLALKFWNGSACSSAQAVAWWALIDEIIDPAWMGHLRAVSPPWSQWLGPPCA